MNSREQMHFRNLEEPDMALPRSGRPFVKKVAKKDFTPIPFVQITDKERDEWNEKMFKIYGF